jgi:predicted membrane protein
MTEQSAVPLRNLLNKVDRERKRATGAIFALVLTSFFFWMAMCFAKDDHRGLPFGLAAVMLSAYVAGMISVRASHENTRTILKAIDSVATEKTTT